jgi:hypothetical protein
VLTRGWAQNGRSHKEAGVADFSWISGDGDWSNSEDWNPTGVPSDIGSNATIDASGTYTVEIDSSEGFAVNSVTLNNAGATLAVDGTLSLESGFSIAAGKITGDGSLFVTGGSIGGGTISVTNQEISGTVTLSASLTDSGSVSLGFSDTDKLALGSNTLKLTGIGSIIAGALTGSGMLALAGGTQEIDSGASLGMAKLVMFGGDSVSLNTSLTYAGTFSQGIKAGLTVASGKVLTLTGDATLLGSVSGSVNVNGGSLVLDTAGVGANLAVNGSSVSLVSDLIYAGGLTGSGSTLALGGRTLTVTGRTMLANVALTTAGTLNTKGVTTVFGVSVKAGAILSNSGSTTVRGQIVLGDAKSAGQFVNAEGATLTLTSGQAASSIVAPAVRTVGTIGLDRVTRPPSVLRNKGLVRMSKGTGRGGVRRFGSNVPANFTSHIAVVFQNLATGTVAVQSGALEFDAAFSNANTKAGALSVAAGTALIFNGGGSSGAGAFSVAADGVVEFSGGTFNLAAGTLQGAAALTGGTLKLGGAVTVAGTFIQAGGTIAGAGTLILAGAANFTGAAGTVVAETGSGKTIIRGKATVGSDFALDNGHVLQNDGTLLWNAGNFELGRNPGGISRGKGQIRNDAGATMIIAGNGVIGAYGDGGSLVNAGTLVKSTSTGNATIAASFQNLGTVSVTAGTLELAATVFGSGGSFRIANGSTLEVDAALPNSQKLIFGAGGGTLVLNDTATYGAAITGFGAQTAIDVTRFKFSGKPNVSFVEAASKKQGVLTLTDGAQSLKVTLFGQYVAAGFHLAADSGGGTVVTYAAPAPHAVLAAGH